MFSHFSKARNLSHIAVKFISVFEKIYKLTIRLIGFVGQMSVVTINSGGIKITGVSKVQKNREFNFSLITIQINVCFISKE